MGPEMIKHLDMKTGNGWAIALAGIIGIGLMVWQTHQYRVERRAENAAMAEREALPVERWYVVRGVFVPDFVQGEDPFIVYDREIRQPFQATWIVEMHPVGDANDFAICTGSGSNYYEPKETLPDSGVKLFAFYMGKKCDVPPGEYILETRWTLTPAGFPAKTLQKSSNIFTILPPGAQTYVTPEQVEKLEADMIGVKGDKGDQGPKGDPGADGTPAQ